MEESVDEGSEINEVELDAVRSAVRLIEEYCDACNEAGHDLESTPDVRAFAGTWQQEVRSLIRREENPRAEGWVAGRRLIEAYTRVRTHGSDALPQLINDFAWDEVSRVRFIREGLEQEVQDDRDAEVVRLG
jgi:hypothetical protein